MDTYIKNCKIETKEGKQLAREMYTSFLDCTPPVYTWDAPDPLPGDALAKAREEYGTNKIGSNPNACLLLEDKELVEVEEDEEEEEGEEQKEEEEEQRRQKDLKDEEEEDRDWEELKPVQKKSRKNYI